MRRKKLPRSVKWALRGFFFWAGAMVCVLLVSAAVGVLMRVWGLLHG